MALRQVFRSVNNRFCQQQVSVTSIFSSIFSISTSDQCQDVNFDPHFKRCHNSLTNLSSVFLESRL